MLTVQLSTETFWSAFDWHDPSAQVHTKQIPVEDMNENRSITIEGEEVEWTKDGVEQILATVGIQCVYNSDVSFGILLVSPPPHFRHLRDLPPVGLLELITRNQSEDDTQTDTPARSPKIEHSSS